MRGIYLLVILVEKQRSIRVGSLGTLVFESGLYAYVGSAQNSLEKRVTRHLTRNKKRFWHIDYLLEDKHVKIVNVFYKVAPKSEECHIAKKIGETNLPIKGFGSSDCNCKSHLFKLNSPESIEKIVKENMLLKLFI